MVMTKNKRKAGVPMEKQRMFKMSQLEQDMLVKACPLPAKIDRKKVKKTE